MEDLKEEPKYPEELNDTQFDAIGNLYGSMIAVVLNNEISVVQFNTICKAYEILGDMWKFKTILREINVTDVENIKPDYLKYFDLDHGFTC